jgi:hypothetical protein
VRQGLPPHVQRNQGGVQHAEVDLGDAGLLIDQGAAAVEAERLERGQIQLGHGKPSSASECSVKAEYGCSAPIGRLDRLVFGNS